MEQSSPARPTTLSLQNKGGCRPAPWNSVRWRSASRTCECCGNEFHPWTKQRADGRLIVQKEIAIELDGPSHHSTQRRLQDLRKTLFLARSGWCVFRMTNQRADELFTTCMSAGTLLISLTASLFITAT